MTFTLRTEVLHLPFRDPFRIARTEDAEASQTVLAVLERDGADGLGECFPVPYYGETVETTAAVLPRLVGALDELGLVLGVCTTSNQRAADAVAHGVRVELDAVQRHRVHRRGDRVPALRPNV